MKTFYYHFLNKLQLCLQLCNTPLVPVCPGDKPGLLGTWAGQTGTINTKWVVSRVAKIKTNYTLFTYYLTVFYTLLPFLSI